MSVALIAVGIDGWEVSSEGLIQSVRVYEPRPEIVIVDNVANPPYPRLRYARIVRTKERICMSEAMNFGAKHTEADWLIFANNDILCHAPYINLVEALDKNTVYGVDMLNWWGCRWLDGWIMVMHRSLWEAVGEFDTNFIYAGFEDADYCFRALEKGFKVEAEQLPFTHKELHSRFTMPGYMDQRERNIAYLCQKWNISR